MKKSIATAALIASAASAFAIIGPPIVDQNGKVLNHNVQQKPVEQGFYCLNVYEDVDGSKTLGSCDEAENNAKFGIDTDQRGCSEGQAALRISPNIQIGACPSYVQL